MTTTSASAARPATAGDLARWFGAACDAATSAAAGRPVRVRIGLSPGVAVTGRISRLRATVVDVDLGGLVVARLTLDARDARLVPTWPPRLRTGPVRIRAEVQQGALDTWTRRAGVPVRLRLRADGLAVRAGLAGIRLADVRAAVEINRGLLMVTPLRGEVLGIGLAAPPVRVPLPIPVLPRGTRLVGLDVCDGRGTFELEVPSLDEPIDGDRIRQARRLRSLGSATGRRSGSGHSWPVRGGR